MVHGQSSSVRFVFPTYVPFDQDGVELHLPILIICRASLSPGVPKFGSQSAFIIILAGYDCSVLRQSCFLNGTTAQVVLMSLLPALLCCRGG